MLCLDRRVRSPPRFACSCPYLGMHTEAAVPVEVVSATVSPRSEYALNEAHRARTRTRHTQRAGGTATSNGKRKVHTRAGRGGAYRGGPSDALGKRRNTCCSRTVDSDVPSTPTCACTARPLRTGRYVCGLLSPPHTGAAALDVHDLGCTPARDAAVATAGPVHDHSATATGGDIQTWLS